MSEHAENTSTSIRLSGSENLKHHEALLEEMRKLEASKSLVLDRVYRYEFAQPVDDGKLYTADMTFGKIRAAKWEPHEYAYDSKEIGGSTRCWKAGEPVLLAKDKKSAVAAIPVLFLRGSGSKAKHRVLLHSPTPSPEFAGLNRGSKRDVRFVSRLLDQFSEETLHAAGEPLNQADLHALQDEAWSFFASQSKSKASTDIDEQQDDDEQVPAAAAKRTRNAPAHRRNTFDIDDEPSGALAVTSVSRLQRHLQDEKEHEKEHKRDLKRLFIDVDELKGRISSLEHQLQEQKSDHATEMGAIHKKLQKLKRSQVASLPQQQVALTHVPAASMVSFANTAPQAMLQAPLQAAFAPPPTGSGGYYYFPGTPQPGASARPG